jgi:hypothetical protein
VDRSDLARWIDAYQRAWRTAGTAALEQLFTADACYRNAPFAEPVSGLEAIAAFWEDARDGADEPFTMRWEPVAVEGAVGVARVEVTMPSPRRTPTATCGSSRCRPMAAAARSRSGRSFPDSRSAPATPGELARLHGRARMLRTRCVGRCAVLRWNQ